MSDFEIAQVKHWMNFHGIQTIEHMVMTFRTENNIIKHAQYFIEMQWKSLPTALCSRLDLFCQFALELHITGPDDWYNITNASFREYWSQSITTPTNNTSMQSHNSSATFDSLDSASAKLIQFAKAVKPDENKFPKLLDNKNMAAPTKFLALLLV